ncbi:hypothetical protein BAUCODRAFT_145249 [Baudoinia panamericana UAMH 10762]|uniref:Uncharacterized protein n=1 Tax=Baudoinia panamericana (strain UAMH 10762) TaxID=717646 RepID=M2MSQ6_BAUPA|nr:uncharacterized protein BAUCODRAFT_145249 [Baudoinia panamericana UAMH 10762]EMC99911.1 hypothetical protein BAUCODRAFT_145249 [Baudoinia panamericana UAMH 10762]
MPWLPPGGPPAPQRETGHFRGDRQPADDHEHQDNIDNAPQEAGSGVQPNGQNANAEEHIHDMLARLDDEEREFQRSLDHGPEEPDYSSVTGSFPNQRGPDGRLLTNGVTAPVTDEQEHQSHAEDEPQRAESDNHVIASEVMRARQVDRPQSPLSPMWDIRRGTSNVLRYGVPEATPSPDSSSGITGNGTQSPLAHPSVAPIANGSRPVAHGDQIEFPHLQRGQQQPEVLPTVTEEQARRAEIEDLFDYARPIWMHQVATAVRYGTLARMPQTIEETHHAWDIIHGRPLLEEAAALLLGVRNPPQPNNEGRFAPATPAAVNNTFPSAPPSASPPAPRVEVDPAGDAYTGAADWSDWPVPPGNPVRYNDFDGLMEEGRLGGRLASTEGTTLVNSEPSPSRRVRLDPERLAGLDDGRPFEVHPHLRTGSVHDPENALPTPEPSSHSSDYLRTRGSPPPHTARPLPPQAAGHAQDLRLWRITPGPPIREPARRSPRSKLSDVVFAEPVTRPSTPPTVTATRGETLTSPAARTPSPPSPRCPLTTQNLKQFASNPESAPLTSTQRVLRATPPRRRVYCDDRDDFIEPATPEAEQSEEPADEARAEMPEAHIEPNVLETALLAGLPIHFSANLNAERGTDELPSN